jgi:hypothetical protein
VIDVISTINTNCDSPLFCFSMTISTAIIDLGTKNFGRGLVVLVKLRIYSKFKDFLEFYIEFYVQAKYYKERITINS